MLLCTAAEMREFGFVLVARANFWGGKGKAPPAQSGDTPPCLLALVGLLGGGGSKARLGGFITLKGGGGLSPQRRRCTPPFLCVAQ